MQRSPLLFTNRSRILDEQTHCVRQTTITLPYFDYEVPVLYMEDGTPYIPVIALCEMLGLRANTHIPRWRKLFLWANARKLPLSTTRGKRVVWCLHLGALPFWCACFNWSLVASERRKQLRQATEAWLEDRAQANQLMLDHYRSLRKDLFAFLVAYSDVEDRLRQWQLRLSPILDVTASKQFEMLITQGSVIIDRATTLARKILHEQAMTPIVDVFMLDANGEVTETGTLPLFPVVAREESEPFFECICHLTQWYRDIAAFLHQESL
jgi:hypothetical protein